MKLQQYIHLLRDQPQYRNLWLASLVSMMGDWFNVIGTVILVNRYTDSTVAVGALFLARSLPPFVLSPVVGVIADRFNRKSILIITDILRALIVLGFLFVDSPERAWLIYALTIAQFVISSFFEPAKSAILPSLLDNEQDLLIANTLSGATWSAMLMLGAAIGGVMAALFGVQAAIIIDAITFLVSAIFVLKIQYSHEAETPTDEGGQTNGLQEFLEGLRFMVSQPRIGLIALVKGFAQFGAPDIMIAVYAAQIFPVGADGAIALGLLFASGGVGAVLGPLIANMFTDGSARKLTQTIGLAFILVAIGWYLFGIASVLPIAMLGLVVRFIGGSTCWTYSTVLLQIKVPNNLLGRVFAIDFAIFTLMASLSVWLTGEALDRTAYSPRDISAILAILSILPSILWGVVFFDQYRNRGVTNEIVRERDWR